MKKGRGAAAGGEGPIDGSESQIVHLRRGPGAGTVEVWRGPCRQPHSGRVRPSIWWNPAIASGKPRCAGGAGGCTPSGSPTRAGASGSEGTGFIPPGTRRRPTYSGGRRRTSPSAPATGTTCRCGSVEDEKFLLFILSDINPCWICDMLPSGVRYIFDAIYPAGCAGCMPKLYSKQRSRCND